MDRSLWNVGIIFRQLWTEMVMFPKLRNKSISSHDILPDLLHWQPTTEQPANRNSSFTRTMRKKLSSQSRALSQQQCDGCLLQWSQWKVTHIVRLQQADFISYLPTTSSTLHQKCEGVIWHGWNEDVKSSAKGNVCQTFLVFVCKKYGAGIDRAFPSNSFHLCYGDAW